MDISKSDLEELRYAKTLLENPSLASKITNIIGFPIEKGFELLPKTWRETVNEATRAALEKALNFALITMEENKHRLSSDIFHKMVVAMTGAAGGAFGLPALAIELPISTTVMLRSIADIARSQGESIRAPETRLSCLQVFAFGSRSKYDDAAETGYFTVRAALAKAISEAAEFISERGLVKEGAPVMVRLVNQIAARFGVAVSEKIAAQTIPIIGAAGGALINTLFIDHFQDIARGHFIVRKLERTYDPSIVRKEYDAIKL